ncbi:MAG: SGNH/GDSL hydrolase family protein [Planctomycetes bacterium]|nr:SGNH/GDSL hydrolase family protein [Planctomycetota bacterium]
MHLSSRFARRSIGVLAGVLIALVVCEAAMRIAGRRPWNAEPWTNHVRVEPGGRFFTKHPTLGYSHLPGAFVVTLPSGRSFRATHGPDALRITAPATEREATANSGDVWIFGCSFVHGWGVNDEETFPWLVREQLRTHDVVNFGVSGYGTIHSLIQLREALASRRAPGVVVLGYAPFHDGRNVLSRSREKDVVMGNTLGPLLQPFARFGPDGTLAERSEIVAFRECPLMRVSALSTAIEEWYDARIDEPSYRSHEVTEKLVGEMADLCRARGIAFVVAGMISSPISTDLLTWCRSHEIRTVDVGVDVAAPENRLPDDPHPNPIAHRRYADVLARFLESDVFARH